MKTSECSFKPFYEIPSFPFCTIPKTENSEMENLGVWSDDVGENSEVFISEFSVLSVVQNGKVGVRKPRSLTKVPQSLMKLPQSKFRGFQLRLFGFGYSTKRKTRSWKSRKTDSPRFPSFPRTPSFRPCQLFSYKAGLKIIPLKRASPGIRASPSHINRPSDYLVQRTKGSLWSLNFFWTLQRKGYHMKEVIWAKLMSTSFPSWRIRDLLLLRHASRRSEVELSSNCAKMSGIFSPPVQVIFIKWINNRTWQLVKI